MLACDEQLLTNYWNCDDIMADQYFQEL